MPSIKTIFVQSEAIALSLKKQYPTLFTIATSVAGYHALRGAADVLKQASDHLTRNGHHHKVEHH